MAPTAAFTHMLPQAFCFTLADVERKEQMMRNYLELSVSVLFFRLHIPSGWSRLTMSWLASSVRSLRDSSVRAERDEGCVPRDPGTFSRDDHRRSPTCADYRPRSQIPGRGLIGLARERRRDDQAAARQLPPERRARPRTIDSTRSTGRAETRRPGRA